MCRAHYERWRRSRPATREADAAYDRRRRATPEYLEYQRQRYRRRKEKKAANNAVQVAVRKGELTKEPCEVCGDPKSQGHHEDYAKPLEVVWLCHTHHAERHRA